MQRTTLDWVLYVAFLPRFDSSADQMVCFCQVLPISTGDSAAIPQGMECKLVIQTPLANRVLRNLLFRLNICGTNNHLDMIIVI